MTVRAVKFHEIGRRPPCATGLHCACLMFKSMWMIVGAVRLRRCAMLQELRFVQPKR